MRKLTDEEKRERTRIKVARFRERHATELAVKIELAGWMGPGRGARGTWRCVELVDDAGLPLWVGALRVSDAPPVIPGARVDATWLPAGELSRASAMALQRFRRLQIASWMGAPDCIDRSGYVVWSGCSDCEGQSGGIPAFSERLSSITVT